MELPTPVDIAHEIPAMVAAAGGSLDLLDMEREVSRQFWPRIQALRGGEGVDYLRQAFNDAITIVIRNNLINSSGTRLLLTDKGWEQASFARAAKDQRTGGEAPEEAEVPAAIDLSNAAPMIELEFEGTRDTISEDDLVAANVQAFIISGEEAVGQVNNKPMEVHPRAHLDAVHAECYFDRICSRPEEPHGLAGCAKSFEPASMTDRQRKDASEYRFRHGIPASRAFVKVGLVDTDPSHVVLFRDGSTETVSDFIKRLLSTRTARLLRGRLVEEAGDLHGQPFTMSAAELLDRLYSAEIDGEPSDTGFYSAMRQLEVPGSAAHILLNRCYVRLPGLEPEQTPQKSLRRTVKRRRASWARVLSEVIAEAGGHADWPTIADAVGRRSEAEDEIGWREEIRQALRNNTHPAGRCYYEAAQIGDKAVYVLIENGRRLASRRTLDERAPTLSKYLAAAVDSHGDSQLTDMELYALLFLATRLGKSTEARAIYHRLPPDYPDEDSYAMIPLWIEQAKSAQEED